MLRDMLDRRPLWQPPATLRAVLLGGAAASTVLLREARERGVAILVPRDVVVAASIDSADASVVSSGRVPAGMSIFDVGPETVREYCTQVSNARTVFWNGPMGVFEKEAFASGTMGLARCVAASAAFTVVGGGDSISAIEAAGVGDRIDHISTGGGASLELLEGRTLPGVAAIPDA